MKKIWENIDITDPEKRIAKSSVCSLLIAYMLNVKKIHPNGVEENFKIPQNTASWNLQRLRKARIVKNVREGKNSYFSLNLDKLKLLCLKLVCQGLRDIQTKEEISLTKRREDLTKEKIKKLENFRGLDIKRLIKNELINEFILNDVFASLRGCLTFPIKLPRFVSLNEHTKSVSEKIYRTLGQTFLAFKYVLGNIRKIKSSKEREFLIFLRAVSPYLGKAKLINRELKNWIDSINRKIKFT